MKKFPKTELLSLFSIVFGIIGFALQSWMFSEIDNRGLLSRDHIAGVISFVLLAIIAVVCFVFTRNIKQSEKYSLLFPGSPVAAVGSLIAAVGIGYSAFTPEATNILRILVLVSGILSAGTLGFAAYCRFQGRQPNCLLYGVVTVYLILRTMTFCRTWGAEPQLQLYFFPLLACLFLLLAAYHRAELGVLSKNCRRYLFFRQLALFCCCLSLVDSDWIFYLSGAVWMATDFCIPSYYGQYAA